MFLPRFFVMFNASLTSKPRVYVILSARNANLSYTQCVALNLLDGK